MMGRLFWIRSIWLILIVVWMAVIFSFSAKNGTQSSHHSGRVTKKILTLCYPSYRSLAAEEQKQVFERTQFLVRKTAHFLEYAILAVLTANFLFTLDKKYIRVIICAVIFSGLFAVSDEIHQGFVADRNPSVKDVCIDTAGACAGSLLSYHIYKISKRKDEDYDIR